MDQPQLAPIADALVEGYLDRMAYSQWFHDQHGQPPTLAAKCHHMRAVVQTLVTEHPTLILSPEWIESGRVQITDAATGRRYLLRSDGAVKIEHRTRQKESLFPAADYLASDVILLVYRFHQGGLDLSVAGTKVQPGKKHLEISGVPSFVATRPWSSDGTSPFDQGFDGFDDLGDEGDIGEGDGG